MFFLIHLFSILVSFSQAKTCQSVFVDHNTMYSKLEETKNSKGNVLLLHGLGNDLTTLEKLANNFKKNGYNILRVDLHGHGKTLKNDLKNNELPSVLPYEENVKDLALIIKNLNFKNPIIIGHSYGGAIAYALANNLKDSHFYRAKSLVLLSPYLRRLDYGTLTGNPFIDMQTEYYTEQMMRQNFREYFISQNKKNVDLLVDSAIAATKGIRPFDILSYNKKAAPDSLVPLFILGAKNDKLVTPEQIQSFHKKLDSEGYPHQIELTEGDHFFPIHLPKETFNIINSFLNRIGSF